jgi:prepilin-type N-terminal cleavage/methylation domain-containing protein
MRHRAFTLLEVLVALLLAGVLAALATELFSGGRLERVDAGVTLLEADMGFARSLAIASPSDPVLLRIATDGSGYHLARASSPDAVLQGPNGPLRVTFGEGRGDAAAGVALSAGALRDVRFGPFGGVLDPVPTLVVSMVDAPERATMVLDPLSGDATVTYQSQ